VLLLYFWLSSWTFRSLTDAAVWCYYIFITATTNFFSWRPSRDTQHDWYHKSQLCIVSLSSLEVTLPFRANFLHLVRSAFLELGLGVAPWPPKRVFGGTPVSQFWRNCFLTYLLISGYHQFVVPSGTRRTDT